MIFLKIKRKNLSIVFIAVIFLALAVAIAFMPTVMKDIASAASNGTQVSIYVSQHPDDTSQIGINAGRYSAFNMTQAEAQTILGTTQTVTHTDVSDWLSNSYTSNKKTITTDAESIPYSNITNGKYRFSNSGIEWNQVNNSISVVFYNNGKLEWYKVMENPSSKYGYSYDDGSSNTNKTDWILAPCKYYDTTGAVQEKAGSDLTIIKSDTTTWSGWMLATGEVTIPNTVKLEEDTNLILMDDAKLTIQPSSGKGINGNPGKVLTIYATNKDTEKAGTFKSIASGSGAGAENTDLIVVGGNVLMQGGSFDGTTGYCGNAFYSMTLSIVVYNGNLTLKGGNGGQSGGCAINSKLKIIGSGCCTLIGGKNTAGDKTRRAIQTERDFYIEKEGAKLFVADAEGANGQLVNYKTTDNLKDNELVMKKSYIVINPICTETQNVNADNGTYNVEINSNIALLKLEKVTDTEKYHIYQVGQSGEEQLGISDTSSGVEYAVKSKAGENARYDWNLDSNGFYQEVTKTEVKKILFFFRKTVSTTTKYYLDTLDGTNLYVSSVIHKDFKILSVRVLQEHSLETTYYHSETEGMHAKQCEKCEQYVNEPHNFDPETDQCVCGEYDPEKVGDVVKVQVEKNQVVEKKKVFLFFTKKVTVYKYTVTVTTASGKAPTGISYSLAGFDYEAISGNTFTLTNNTGSFFLKTQDQQGTNTYWKWKESDGSVCQIFQ